MAGHWWLMPVILGTLEVKIWRITVPDHLGQKVFQILSLQKKVDMVAHIVIPATAKIGGIQSRPVRQKERPYLKNRQKKKGSRHGSSSRVPACKPKALSPNPSTLKTAKTKQNKQTNKHQGTICYRRDSYTCLHIRIIWIFLKFQSPVYIQDELDYNLDG
jgi:hypothetical protein